ncbi:hypothetical protein MMC22_011056 [Lobaria immixta]|nr:hypothetical protein [Lobaria immixta]
MPSSPALTIALFGATAFILGIYTLLSPSVFLLRLQLLPAALPALYSNGLAATAMGVYYTLAAYQENKVFFIATVPVRLLSTAVFWAQGGQWRATAVWEGTGASLTGTALLWEAMRKTQVEKRQKKI